MSNNFEMMKVRKNKHIKGKKHKNVKPYVYTEPTWTVYKISNIFDDRIYVGVTGQSLQARFKNHKSSAFTSSDRIKFYEFVRSVSEYETFDDIFTIEPIISGIAFSAYATQIENAVISTYLSKGALLFNTMYTSKYDHQYEDLLKNIFNSPFQNERLEK